MKLWALPLLTVMLVIDAFAQGAGAKRLAGIVVDTAGRPIQFANVVALPNGPRIVAGTDGRFAFEVNAGVREVEIRRIGFEPRVVGTAAWPDTALQIALASLPARLERVRVEANQQIQSLALRGFYDRQAELEKGINHGFIITPEEIEQRKGARVTDFFRGFAAVTMVRAGPRPGRPGRTGLMPMGQGGCRHEIYVDGIRFYRTRWPPDPQVDDESKNEYVDDLIDTNTIAGMEFYPRAVGAPPKYQSLNGACGVILIWTK